MDEEPIVSRRTWAIVTGEYPPQPGGVSDYTWLLARSLSSAGDDVHVWAPACTGLTPSESGVTIHRLPGHFGPISLVRFAFQVAQLVAPRRMLIQYVPQAFGFKGCNIAVPIALCMLSRYPVWTMFHEVAVSRKPNSTGRQQLLAFVTGRMAKLMTIASSQILTSTPAYAEILSNMAGSTPVQWLPIISNISTEFNAEDVQLVRDSLASGLKGLILGHFVGNDATAWPFVAQVLARSLRANPGTRCVLVGRHGVRFLDAFTRNFADVAWRARATGELSRDDAALQLASCDIVIQPYEDGISARRGTALASLAIGIPLVSNCGILTESFWSQSDAIELAKAVDADLVAAAVTRLVHDEQRRRVLGLRGAELYRTTFSIDALASALRAMW